MRELLFFLSVQEREARKDPVKLNSKELKNSRKLDAFMQHKPGGPQIHTPAPQPGPVTVG